VGDMKLDEVEQGPGLILVVDDDEPLRKSLDNLLRSVGFEVALFESATELLSFRFPDVPTCILLDVRLRGQSGLDLQSKLAALDVDAPIVFMTGFGDIAMSVTAMKAGAHDFLPKPIRDQDLLDAINGSLDKHRTIRAGREKQLQIAACYKTLTARESQVLGYAATGLLNKQIAAELGISEVTVKIHRGNVMRKMNARNFAELVLQAQQLGLCAVEPK